MCHCSYLFQPITTQLHNMHTTNQVSKIRQSRPKLTDTLLKVPSPYNLPILVKKWYWSITKKSKPLTLTTCHLECFFCKNLQPLLCVEASHLVLGLRRGDSAHLAPRALRRLATVLTRRLGGDLPGQVSMYRTFSTTCCHHPLSYSVIFCNFNKFCFIEKMTEKSWQFDEFF